MADYTHLMNLIQGEVMRIKERRPLMDRAVLLDDLINFLGDQRQTVIIEKLRVLAELPHPDDETPGESAVEE